MAEVMAAIENPKPEYRPLFARLEQFMNELSEE